MRAESFGELPEWLQRRLRDAWADICPTPGSHTPPIGDPEFRVYRLGGGGWWAVASETTRSVTVEREDTRLPYDGLPERSELRQAVDAAITADMTAEHIATLSEIVLGRGVEPTGLALALSRWRGEGIDEEGVLWGLIAALDGWRRTGTWELT